LAEEKKGIFVYLVGLSGINQGLYELLLCVIQTIVGVLFNPFCEVADEGVPVDEELAITLPSDLVVPE
jgi:hypothetical protein